VDHEGRAVDAATTSVVRSGLSVVADAIGITAVRAAYSTTVKGGSDVSSGLFDAAGRLVALSEVSMIGHLAPLRCAARSILADFPAATMAPGDVFLMNDPYRGGVHANDMQVFTPIFVGGDVAYLAASMVHVADVGGTSAGGLSGTVTDMFQEGLTLPPVKLHAAGRPVDDVYRIVAVNSRTPDTTIGDIQALVAGTRAGERELTALIGRLGPDGDDLLRTGVQAMFAHTESRVRHRLAAIGPQTGTGEAVIDDDGVRLDTPLRVRVRLTVRSDRLVIDFTGTDVQAVGPVSAPEGPAVSAALYGAWILMDDPDLPVNEGVFAGVEIVRPEGSLVAPRRPAAANARGFTMVAILDAMLQAMSGLRPHGGVAGSGVNHVMTVAMNNGRGHYRAFHDIDYGGAGARSGSAGVDAHGYGIFSGRAQVTPMELIEGEHDVVFECHRLRPGSAGTGRWPGGRGVEKRLRVLRNATVTVRTDKERFPPAGAAGGGPGAPGGWIVNAGTPDERRLRSKETNVALGAGDTITMLTPGGGGFGGDG
jgi:N-methylhydantoinase B